MENPTTCKNPSNPPWTAVLLSLALLAAAAPAAGQSPAASRNHSAHHVAMGYGYARHGSKDSDYVALDYTYTFPSTFTLGGYFEDVRGAFDTQAFGISFGKKYASGLRFSVGPGIETKLKDNSNLLLFRGKAGFDWHRDRWSFGPSVSYDAIEDTTNTWYAGIEVGYSF